MNFQTIQFLEDNGLLEYHTIQQEIIQQTMQPVSSESNFWEWGDEKKVVTDVILHKSVEDAVECYQECVALLVKKLPTYALLKLVVSYNIIE